MTFTTLTFFLFLAIVFAAYWSLPTRAWQNRLIVVAGFVFYGWWDWRFCLLMGASTLVDFSAAIIIGASEKRGIRKAALIGSMVFSLGMLAFFKYFNFFAASFVESMGALGWHVSPVTVNVILPVGISFYTFQSIGYVIDVYRRQIAPCRSVRDYLAFVAFFPQLVAGPIERAGHLLAEVQRDRFFDPVQAKDACRRILWGLWKKMVIADNLAPLVESAFAHPEDFTGGRLALATVFFAIQIYCDFSGYSDIAIGGAKLFGIDLMRNFAHPYFSRDPGEFWRRWHISLSTWFRDYVFIPLGGNQGSRWRRGINLMLTFGISGLWHGAGWNYLTWGLLNGFAVLPSSLWGARAKRRATDVPGGETLVPSLPNLFRMVATFAIICVTWVFFRSSTFAEALTIFAKLVTDPLPGSVALKSGTGLPENAMIGLVLLFVLIEWLTRRHAHAIVVTSLPRAVRWTVYTVVFWSIFILMPQEPSTFIYFQF